MWATENLKEPVLQISITLAYTHAVWFDDVHIQ